jgi:hypothetical protein
VDVVTGPWPRPGDRLYTYDSNPDEFQHERAAPEPEFEEEPDEDEVLRRLRDGIGEL